MGLGGQSRWERMRVCGRTGNEWSRELSTNCAMAQVRDALRRLLSHLKNLFLEGRFWKDDSSSIIVQSSPHKNTRQL